MKKTIFSKRCGRMTKEKPTLMWGPFLISGKESLLAGNSREYFQQIIILNSIYAQKTIAILFLIHGYM